MSATKTQEELMEENAKSVFIKPEMEIITFQEDIVANSTCKYHGCDGKCWTIF